MVTYTSRMRHNTGGSAWGHLGASLMQGKQQGWPLMPLFCLFALPAPTHPPTPLTLLAMQSQQFANTPSQMVAIAPFPDTQVASCTSVSWWRVQQQQRPSAHPFNNTICDLVPTQYVTSCQQQHTQVYPCQSPPILDAQGNPRRRPCISAGPL